MYNHVDTMYERLDEVEDSRRTRFDRIYSNDLE